MLHSVKVNNSLFDSVDECGIVAQISEPLATADIPAYYISTFKFDHALVREVSNRSSTLRDAAHETLLLQAEALTCRLVFLQVPEENIQSVIGALRTNESTGQ